MKPWRGISVVLPICDEFGYCVISRLTITMSDPLLFRDARREFEAVVINTLNWRISLLHVTATSLFENLI